MIAIGMLVVFRSTARGSRLMAGEHVKADANADDVVYATALLGSYKRRIASQRFAGGEVTAIMGGCELDLREASIEGDAVLHVFALMGGIDIKVPVDWTVVLEGVPMLGGFEETTLRPKDAGKRLVVRGHAIMGGLEITN
jgi:predicted membrane protein